MNSKEIILDIFELLFKQASKKFGSEYDKTSKEIQDELFNYYNKIGLDNTHLVLINGFSSNLGTGFVNKSYNNKTKKEDTIPLYIQNYSFGSISYLNSLTTALRSKKNNRPIYFRFNKVNGAFIQQMQKALNFWKSNAPFQSKVGMFSKTIMPVVFTGKDEELQNQEKLLNNIYSLYKNRYFRISIKGIYSIKETSIGLLKLYNSKELQDVCSKNEKIKMLVQKKILEKSEKLRDLNIFIDGKEELELIEMYLKGKNIQYEKDDQFNIYSQYFNEYLKNYIFYEETILNLIKSRDFGLKDLYENDKFLHDGIFYTDLVKEISDLDQKSGKILYKKLNEGEGIEYKEYVINSFLTQPDLSNSLELVQDVFQGFLRGLSIGFDDKYITEISAKMLRYSKEDKQDTIFKNINFFNLSKLK